MNPEELRKQIESLREENKKALNELDSLMAKRQSFSDANGSALSDEEREARKNELQKIDSDIDNMLQNIENRNAEINRIDKLLSVLTNGSMNKRNVFGDIDNKSTNADAEKELRASVDRWFKSGNYQEVRDALQSSVAAAGGNTVAPQYLVKNIIKNLDNEVQIRKYANIIPAVAGYDSLGIPTLDKDLADHEWTAEIGKVNEDTSLAFGKREMKPNQLTKLVKISKRLIRESNIDIQGFVEQRIAYKLSVPLEHNYLYGDGKGKPLGIFAQTSDNSAAITKDRDIKVGTSKEAISYDGLVDATSGLKKGHLSNAVWMLNKQAVASLRKFKDSTGRPIWTEGIQGAQPSYLMGIPVIQNDFITDKLEKGKYIGFLADLKNYWILDSFGMELQVLYELYSETNQVGFQAGYWGDGAPVLEEAFVRLLPYDGAYTAPSTPSEAKE